MTENSLEPVVEEYLTKALSSLVEQQLQATATEHPPPPSYVVIQSPWSFTQGLILGQISIIVLAIFFIRFFVFSESIVTTGKRTSSTTTNNTKTTPLIRNKKTRGQDITTSLHGVLSSSNNGNTTTMVDDNAYNNEAVLATILEKTYYDVDRHQAESLDWFNVLIAQIIFQVRHDALNNDNIYHSLNEAFNKKTSQLDYLSEIEIEEINIGDDYPIFSNCRIKYNDDGRLEAKIDLDVSDTFTLGINTKLLINQPKALSAALPVKLSVSIVRFSACLTMSFISTSDELILDQNKTNNDGAGDDEPNEGGSIALMFSFSPDFRLEFDTKSLIGSRAKLENIPRLKSIIENVLRNWFIERCIEPRFQLVRIPSLWPTKNRTRQPLSATTTAEEEVE